MSKVVILLGEWDTASHLLWISNNPKKRPASVGLRKLVTSAVFAHFLWIFVHCSVINSLHTQHACMRLCACTILTTFFQVNPGLIVCSLHVIYF